VVDTLDDRLSSTVWEQNGKIYTVHTITALGGDHTELEWQISDAATNTILSKGLISDPNYDYFQGSLAVNKSGQVVIGYNRSGSGADGKISIFAQTFNTVADSLVSTGTFLLKVSDTDAYHNGSVFGKAAAGRQRWGDYAQVSVDPTNDAEFWVVGEYAREFNSPQFGHPRGTGGSRWATWISSLTLGAVPEPATWTMMLLGLGGIGATLRRRNKLAAQA